MISTLLFAVCAVIAVILVRIAADDEPPRIS